MYSFEKSFPDKDGSLNFLIALMPIRPLIILLIVYNPSEYNPKILIDQ